MAGNIVLQNQQYFNQQAATYDTQHVELLNRLTVTFRDNLDFIGADWKSANGPDKTAGSAKLLDYACGTGMMTRTLGQHFDQCIGIDLSPQMVEIYNTRAAEENIPSSERYAVQGDLADPAEPSPSSLSGPEFYGFALAAVGGGFHHFANPELAAKRIVERLSPGGVLTIWDFFAHDKDAGVHDHDHNHHDHDHNHDHNHDHGHGHGQEHPSQEKPHDAAHTVTRHGFSEAELKDMFTAAGAGQGFAVLDLGDYTFSRDDRPFRRRVFLARGQKPKGGTSAEASL